MKPTESDWAEVSALFDELVEEAIRDGARRGVEVFPARENRTVVVGDPPRLPS